MLTGPTFYSTAGLFAEENLLTLGADEASTRTGLHCEF